MRRNRIVPLLFLLCLMPVLLAGRAKINVISVGDSWAEGWCDAMERVIRLHGTRVEVWNRGISGSAAVNWATPGALLDVELTLLQHPEIDWLTLSIGGNDLLDGYLLMGLGDEVFPLIDEALRTVLDELLAFRPELKISLNGYDFPNFEHTLDCIVMGQAMLGGNTYSQNHLFAQITDIAAAIADDYPQVHHTALLGAMQQADGMPLAPNYYRPSPARFFPEEECIHPTAGGYDVVMERLWDEFFEPLNNPTDDDTVDDDTVDDDTSDDDAVDDDLVDDDAIDDDVIDDDDLDDDADNDDAVDDDAADDDDSSADDDDDDDGCSC
ncbi:MAG TPA: SGNH/GDSL hydrolase family protein [bacterium]|nr:SGNH/GDSL hydrolase family protein [bacterium]